MDGEAPLTWPSKTPRTPTHSTVAEQKEEKQRKDECKKMEEQVRGLVNQRAAVRGKLTRIRAALRDSADKPNPNIKNVHFLQLHKKTVENCYQECNEIQNKIYAQPLSEDRLKIENESYVEFESLYNDVALNLSMLIDNIPKTEAAIPVAVSGPSTSALQPMFPVQPYLPPLQVPLPTFNGTYENWYSFKSMFTTVMNRCQQEEPALKLFHLRKSLVGQAAGIIDQELVNNNDYNAAWMVLTQRYEDKRIVRVRSEVMETLQG